MKILGFFISFVIVLLLTPIIRKFALKKGFIDKANGDPLKIHKESVAMLGGVVILVAMAVGMFLAYSVERIAYSLELKMILAIAIGGVAVFWVGFWDDIKLAKPRVRVLLEILAGIIVLLVGIRVNFIPVRWIIVPLTIFYIVGAINAFNVIDGMDGLCTGVSLISCIGFFFLGLNNQNNLLMVLSAVLFMSLLGFLPYNFHSAKIFLGNAGSGLIGFLMGAMAVMATAKPYGIANFIAAILVIGVPVFDMAFAILRRLIRRKPLSIGDRDHLYDLLLKKGWSQPKVWCVMCGMQLVLVAIALGIV